MKRSQGTTPCVVKDSSCHIMQAETINGHEEFVLQFSDTMRVFFFILFRAFLFTHFFIKGGKNFVRKNFVFLYTLKAITFFSVLQIALS